MPQLTEVSAPPTLSLWRRMLPLSSLILACACLAFAPLLVRLADVSPMSSAFWRVSLATPMLLVAALVTARPAAGKAPPRPLALRTLPWGLGILAGVMFGIDLPAFHYGIMQTTTANATLFGNGAAFLIAGWAMFRGEEPADGRNLSAMAMAFIGALMLLGASAEIGGTYLVGDLLCLLGTVLYAVYLMILMRLRQTHSTPVVLAIATGVSALVALPLALLAPGSFWPQNWAPVATYAVSSQFLGQGLLIYASGSLPASVVGLGLLIQPVLSAISGWMVFGETMNPMQLLGAVTVCAAIVLVRR